MLPPLLAALSPLDVAVVLDPSPDPAEALPSSWRTYRRALDETPADATHRIVLQDDTRPCRNFALALGGALAAVPDRVIVLCLCGRPVVTAHRAYAAHSAGLAWIDLYRNQWLPTLAVAWPTRLVRPVLDWIDGKFAGGWDPRFQADDEVLMRALAKLGEEVLVAVPSLVQHDDLVPSLLGTRHKAKGGTDAGRVAAIFADDVIEDPATIDWSRGGPKTS